MMNFSIPLLFRQFMLGLGILAMVAVFLPSHSFVSAVTCHDIKYDEKPLKWTGEGHGDNSPSESKFFWTLEHKTFCETNKDIDHMVIKGHIKEGTSHDWDWLKQTIFYQSVDEKTQHKLWVSYSESPDDDGDKNLADYEMVEATY